MTVEAFREEAYKPVLSKFRLVMTTVADGLWVGVYDLSAGGRPGGTHVWSRRYSRPAGKTESECLEAALRMALQAAQDGLLTAPSDPE